MAEAADILSVKDLLPSKALEDEGWDDAKITVYLDAGKSVSGVLLQYWDARSAQLYQMIDVSESGSSRSLGKIYDNAKSMAEYWRDRVKSEKEDEKAEETEAAQYTRLHKITRV